MSDNIAYGKAAPLKPFSSFGSKKRQLDNLSSFGPFAPIIGALVGGVIGAFVTYYFVVRRKYVLFRIGQSIDITLPLRAEAFRARQFHMSIKIGDLEFHNLNKCTVNIRNKGNAAIQNLTFDVTISGNHTVLPTVLAKELALSKSIQVLPKYDEKSKIDPIYTVCAPYLNPGELFDLVLFFDGPTDECRVYCRMEDVKTKIKRLPFDPWDVLEGGARFYRRLGFFLISHPRHSRSRSRRGR